jgi:hypothetical protein
MIVEFRCDIGRPRRWMDRNTMRIDGRDVDIQVAWVKSDTPKQTGLDSLFSLERMLLRKGKPSEADVLNGDALKRLVTVDPAPDVVIDFTEVKRDPSCKAPLYLRPVYNGVAGEVGALSAILTGDLPIIEITNEIDGEILGRGRPSKEVAEGLSGSLATVIARTITLLAAILSGRSRAAPPVDLGKTVRLSHAPASFVLAALAEAIARRIYRLCCYSPHWQIGWRHVDDGGVWQHKDLSGPRWRTIGVPGHRSYADPFPVTWKGRTFVMFEDLDHRAAKGGISAIEFDDSGPKGGVVHVLEEPWHLSYPFMIADGDDLWLLPESVGNNDVAAYKCIEFPGKWERQPPLLSGLSLADSTIIHHDGLYYLFGAAHDGAGGYSDTLSIFQAVRLCGPWMPHACNPIFVDRASARPAGNFVTLGGNLWRPVQDCTDQYGGAIGLARIEKLSPTSFRQTVRHVIRPGPQWPRRKLHTLNRSGRLEVIDGTRLQSKLGAAMASRFRG